ncbi:MAG: serine hydrolase domain-containing protein [Bacteroidota bacterium]
MQVQELLDSLYKDHEGTVGILLHVESPSQRISWTSAVGVADTLSKEPLQNEHPVLIASNTKPYVAASILRLVEQETIKLDDPIQKLLGKKTRRLFEKDGYDLKAISVRHLLSHTSGIHDYVNEAYFEFVNQHPAYNWQKEEQLTRAVEVGDPLWAPGTAYGYADVNYLLLTEILERKTGKPFHAAIRDLLKFDSLGIRRTWFKDLEPFPAETLPLAHQYADTYGWDSYKIDHSWDLYGGGGMAATVKDAALFFQYLFEGKMVSDTAVLKQMHTYVLPKETSNYCLGIRNIPLPNQHLYYHGGWWGTGVVYSPETRSTVAVFTLQKGKRERINPFLGKKIQEMLLAE